MILNLKKMRFYNILIFLVVAATHIYFIFHRPVTVAEIDFSSDSLSYVDLSGLSTEGATATANTGNPIPAVESKPAPEPQPQPIKEPESKPEVLPVTENEKTPDVVVKKVEPKKNTKKEPKLKPEKKVEKKQKPDVPTKNPEKATSTDKEASVAGGEQANTNHSGSGAGAKGTGSGVDSGGDGGNSSGSITPPKHSGGYLNNPKPQYPAISRENGEEGRVGIRVKVTADGKPESVEIAKSSGFPRLDNAAKEAVKHYTFVPAKRGNEQIPYTYTFDINFDLSE